MDNFPGNSRNLAGQPSGTSSSQPSAEEPPKVEKVISGTVIRRQKPFGRRILDTLFRGDGGVVSYLAKEVLVPAFQTLVTDMVTQGIEKAVYGEVRSPSRSARGSSLSRPHISYDRPNSIVRSPLSNGAPARRPISTPSSLVLEEVILDTDFNAQIIMERLYELLEEFGAVTVAMLRESLGESPTYVDYKWGWRNLDAMHKKRVKEGFLVYLPDPENLR